MSGDAATGPLMLAPIIAFVATTRPAAARTFYGDVLGLRLTRADASVSALRARGVVFERYPFMAELAAPIWTAPGGAQVAWFKDPDGNTLSLTQLTA